MGGALAEWLRAHSEDTLAFILAIPVVLVGIWISNKVFYLNRGREPYDTGTPTKEEKRERRRLEREIRRWKKATRGKPNK